MRLRLVLCALVAALLGALPGTTTASAATFKYDAPTVVRVDAQQIEADAAGRIVLSEAREESASLSVRARGVSRTSRHGVIATEAESGLVTAGETCNSFEHDTDVLMADGSRKPIDKVKVGDSVIATDPATGKTGSHAVTALIRHTTDHTIVGVSVAGEDRVETIAATDHHPFYVTSDGGRWVDAGALAVGDELRSPDGTPRVIAGVTTRRAHETVYNLTIDGVHTYYVGEQDPVLVHNSGACDIGSGHAFDKHVVDEGQFPGVRTRAEFQSVVDDVTGGPQLTRALSNGRTAYWKNGVVVIENPGAVDGGTMFVPKNGIDYFKGLK